MEKFQITLRVTANERKMLMKRASRYGMTINGLVRFWINSESNSPRAFCKITCTACDGTPSHEFRVLPGGPDKEFFFSSHEENTRTCTMQIINRRGAG
jgi:hypothetical protein